MTSGLFEMGFIRDFAVSGMAISRAWRATQRSIGVGCSRALNPRLCRISAQPVSTATTHTNTIPRKNQRTASLYPFGADRSEHELGTELHNARRGGLHHLSEQRIVEVARDSGRTEELRVVKRVERLPAEL